MMKISEDDVSHIAVLSRLKLSEDEKKKFQGQLNSILIYVEQLNEIDTGNVEPTSHILNVENVFRDDINERSLSVDESLSNSPDRSENFYKVPKIID